MSKNYTVLSEVINEKRPVSAGYALLIEAALGIKSDFPLRLQTSYNLIVAKRSPSLKQRIKTFVR